MGPELMLDCWWVKPVLDTALDVGFGVFQSFTVSGKVIQPVPGQVLVCWWVKLDSRLEQACGWAQLGPRVSSYRAFEVPGLHTGV